VRRERKSTFQHLKAAKQGGKGKGGKIERKLEESSDLFGERGNKSAAIEGNGGGVSGREGRRRRGIFSAPVNPSK